MDTKNNENNMKPKKEEIGEIFAGSEAGAEEKMPAQEETAQQKEEKERACAALDFRGEVRELLERYPQLRERFAAGEGLPVEVVAACAKEQIPLRVAYAEYELRAAKTELEQLRKENESLRHNTNAAAKAPVKGAAQGGTNEQRKDPFLEGLFSE